MKKINITIVLIFLFIRVSCQDESKIEFDNTSFQFGDSIKIQSIDNLIAEVNKYSSNDSKKLFVICGWIFKNIDFDLNKFETGGVINDYETTIQTKRGVCGDYATLFSEICNRLKIKNFLVEGYVPELDSVKKVYFETNHLWNIVNVNNNWYHCDLLFTSGYIKKNAHNTFKFVKKVNPKTYLVNSTEFLKNHMPADPMWQLRTNPYDLSAFLEGRIGLQDTLVKSRHFNFIDSINSFEKLSEIERILKFTNNAYSFNNLNHNIVITNNYNLAVELYNQWKKTKNKEDLKKAKKLFLIAKEHIQYAYGDVKNLEQPIYTNLNIIQKYVP
jgi:hypothetical protein